MHLCQRHGFVLLPPNRSVLQTNFKAQKRSLTIPFREQWAGSNRPLKHTGSVNSLTFRFQQFPIPQQREAAKGGEIVGIRIPTGWANVSVFRRIFGYHSIALSVFALLQSYPTELAPTFSRGWDRTWLNNILSALSLTLGK